ncbi:MAG TPA: fumarylacetoacetate hydrolase family protein [Termitinemataceae bacterium]|nr:fumarylacetoacetate hydrolase family protein [Termitinemataceae bacterium]HOM22595.1 fumarylacetoacetate hydrolase family protein [Termitinemataceae bacterium]HPQ00049.1 fumarylacetoacetate hydrolase family protein [Termitinemataceae bacterium]
MLTLPVQGGGEYTLRPSKIICVGFNYLDHVEESSKITIPQEGLPKEPILFAKTPNVLVGPGEPILIPRLARLYQFPDLRIDHEAELACIIGKRGKWIPEEQALGYVYGYTCFNDVSCRNIQKSDSSGWFRGKSFDTFGPIGPVIVRSEDIPDPQNLAISCRVNERITQHASTKQMLFSVATLISFISRHMTLEAGDIIATGTPSGVSPISPGDVVEVAIERIGVLTNPVMDEPENLY